MNFGTIPPFSHGSIEGSATIMPADAATLKPLHEFGPATVFVHGAIESFVGYRAFQASRVSLQMMSYAQYDRAIRVTLVPRGKRKEQSYIEVDHASTVVVEGWVDEPLPASHDATGAARHAGLDQEWDHEFGIWLEKICRASSRKILADLRGHDPQLRRASAGPVPPQRLESPPSDCPLTPAKPVPRCVEGAATEIVQTRYERNPAARAACLAHFGLACQVCGFDFEQRFGELGAGFIHVHHLEPLAITAQQHSVDPIRDLRPVCPNCHAMLHRRNPPLALDELRVLRRGSSP